VTRHFSFTFLLLALACDAGKREDAGPVGAVEAPVSEAPQPQPVAVEAAPAAPLDPAPPMTPAVQAAITEKPVVEVVPVAAVPLPGAQWEYSDTEDPMGGAKNKSAALQSTNRINHPFPYEGDIWGTIMLRKHPRMGTDVLVAVSDGQLNCSSYSNCTVTVRFDDSKPIKFSADEAASGSNKVIFLRKTKPFIAAISKSKLVRIELSMYNAGVEVFEFNTEGLKGW